MSIARSQIVAAARSLIGTPFHHQGRVAGKDGGIDCIGLLVCVARILGVPHEDIVNYAWATEPGQRLLEELRRHLTSGSTKVSDGSVLVFWIQTYGRPTHIGIRTTLADGRPGIVHADGRPGINRAVEIGLTDHLMSRLIEPLEFPGVQN